ncbi:MAG: acylphosphatase [Desulfosarcina sp.]|jgi:acylphosphatase
MEEKARARLIVSGRVQGVCFRAETQRAAGRYGVTGWVRNRPDGTVQAEIEGQKKDVLALINWCQTGPPIARVETVDVTWADYRGDYPEFNVRY